MLADDVAEHFEHSVRVYVCAYQNSVGTDQVRHLLAYWDVVVLEMEHSRQRTDERFADS